MAMMTLSAALTGSTGPSTSRSMTGKPLRDRVFLGASFGDPRSVLTKLPLLEAKLGKRLDIASAFVDWSHVLGSADEIKLARGGATKVLLSWEPFGVRFTDVTDGRKDGYLREVASSVRRFPHLLYVRPWPEMNASWSSWQPTESGRQQDGGTPQEFVAAWRYMVSFLRGQGVANLRFVFSVDASENSTNTDVELLWPGAAYVDLIGIDGYNWGASVPGPKDSGDRWDSFTTIFAGMYERLTKLHPSTAIWITEFGCKDTSREDNANYPRQSSPRDPHNSKAAWLRDVLSLTSFPQLEALVYFNNRKERDWRMESPPEALAAFRSALWSREPPR